MADSNIGALPQAPQVADDSLLVMEQQGTAMKLTGAQLKDYAKHGVEIEFQDHLDEAKAAADSAAKSAAAITGMKVEAQTLDSGKPATVTKSVRGGVVTLAFGLPKGERGEPGPEGRQGPRGPQGAPGTGLDILGHYDTEDALRSAVTAPNVGDAYSVGVKLPYDTYVFDGVTLDWKNYGPLGGSGGVIPEDVVTSEGGASLEYGFGIDGAPHVITFTAEEEPPLTAEDITYGEATVKEALDGLKSSVSDGKSLVASAITDKGIPTKQDATFQQMADNILDIQTGTDTKDATATSWDILSPKTAYTSQGKVTGLIPSLPAQIITPGTAAKTIANGQYLSGTQTIQGDANLTSSNIKKGVSIFGVAGALETSFKATLTVTVEVGAEVRATSGSKVITALSTTGTVVMELPSEGTWSITAARGMTQYTTAVITVASQFKATLVPINHVDYLITATPLSESRINLAAASIGNYALFAGGDKRNFTYSGNVPSSVVDAYNDSFTRSMPTALSVARSSLASIIIGSYALFAGELTDMENSAKVDAYNASLTRSTPTPLSEARTELSAAKVGDYALFAGGYNSTTVDAYNTGLTRSTPTVLISGRYRLAGATVGDYALFAGGLTGSSELSAIVDAYNSKLTRSTPVSLGVARCRLSGATSGGYALFAGGAIRNDSPTSFVDAYDISLVRTTPAALSSSRYCLAATTCGTYTLFGGGVGEAGTPNSVGDVKWNLSKAVDSYDFSLTKRITADLNKARGYLSATSLGNYALFGGGANSVHSEQVGNSSGTFTRKSIEPTNVVDVYQYT